MKQCTYCFENTDGDACPNCGSKDLIPEPQHSLLSPRPGTEDWGAPFSYNGYIVWTLARRGFCDDTCTWHFYLGDKLVEAITLSREVLQKFVPAHTDAMPLVWDLFKVAQGEDEVLRISEQNKRRPAQFEIRRVNTPREEQVAGLTYSDVIDAVREGEREF